VPLKDSGGFSDPVIVTCTGADVAHELPTRFTNERPVGVTLGTAAKVIELDQDLKIAWQLDENEVPGNPLRLPAGCQRLPNGNTIVCNYLPGSFLGKQPQAFEVTRDKRVVWEFTDHARFKTVNQIYLLDLPGDLKKSGVLR